MSASAPKQAENYRGLEHLLPLMEARGVSLDARDFHQTVNLVFHGFESEVYDSIHIDMKRSLPRVFNTLAESWLSTGAVPERIRVLDIGCGTGLSSELLMGTCLGTRVEHLDMLDTSTEMLRKCDSRKSLKSSSRTLILGTLDRLTPGESYDLILTCSVLHHIPNLAEFLDVVARFQRPGGAFMHVQDPNGDYLHDHELAIRNQRLENRLSRRARPLTKRLRPKRILDKLRRQVTGHWEKSYIERINDELLSRRVIAEPLSEVELWQITDLHVFDGKGVSIKEMRQLLSSYSLVSARSYSFFGEMCSELPRGLRAEEMRLFSQHAPNGQHIGAIWRR
jgi:2-polyprenyl-3-methyl-5-hydroxy-6-metoxy-1,4-benzoquinol methylase